MLKLTIKPGEYINIGEDIRIVFSGGSANNMHILVDAPRELNIVRSGVLKKTLPEEERRKLRTYHKEADLSEDAKAQIQKIVAKDRFERKQREALQKNR
ncbi:MAG: carbon storage regulator [Lachnospiraceae bacterium]|nr:carbon storage regulator [Lachnospiraceae bacterium]